VQNLDHDVNLSRHSSSPISRMEIMFYLHIVPRRNSQFP